jgi:hypothetical protein
MFERARSHGGTKSHEKRLRTGIVRSSQVVKASDSQSKAETVLGLILPSSDTVESEGWQMKLKSFVK